MALSVRSTSSHSSTRMVCAVSFSCVMMMVLFDVSSGFQNHFHHTQNPSMVGRSIPLMLAINLNNPGASINNMALFAVPIDGMEGDPLEDNGGQAKRKLKRYVSPRQGNPATSTPNSDGQPRLVRPASPQDGNERKATTSTVGGVNLELKDPKERKLVRHATASAAYGVDDFKGKKKKIIRPWRSGRKKHRNQQNNIGGLGREAYNEELRIELKNEPKNKRLVMARTTSGSQEAAKALMGGSKKAEITAQDIAEERRFRNRRRREAYDKDKDRYDEEDEDEYCEDIEAEGEQRYYEENEDAEGEPQYYEENEDADGEPKLVPVRKSMVRKPGDGEEDGPSLVRPSTSMVRPADSAASDKPNLVRMSSSIMKEPSTDEDGNEQKNLVRLESSIVREPDEQPEGQLKYYSRAEAPDEDKEEGQKLVRAVRASPSSTSDGPKLVRPNFVQARDTGPKLARPNFVRAKEGGPKLVRPNLVKAKTEGPKLVRPKIQKQKTEGPKLVRPNFQKQKIEGPNLVRAKIVKDPAATEEFMYGASPSSVSPTAVPLPVKARRLVSPSSTSASSATSAEEQLMYGSGSGRSATPPTSVPVESKPKKYVRPTSTDSDAMDDLMYGSKKATASPTAVSPRDMKPGSRVTASDSFANTPMDGLMYGASQAVPSPTSVPHGAGSNRSGNLVKPQPGSTSSTPIDDLMYGHQRTFSSPTEVKVEAKATKLVKPSTSSDEEEKDDSATGSRTIYPDWDKRKVVNEPRLVRASTQKRYVEPKSSLMGKAQNWDAANPPATTTNPTFVRMSKPNVSSKGKTDAGENGEAPLDKPKMKRYIRPSGSAMNNTPDWDAVQSAFSVSNPVAVDVSKSQKKYIKPLVSSMDSAPDWDHTKPPVKDPNPSVVNVDGYKGEKDTKRESEGKKYVEPSSSSMKDAADWDHAKPSVSTNNPSVMNVDPADKPNETKDEPDDKALKKKYVKPSSSVMQGAPDWDHAKPPISTDNPSVINVDAKKTAKETKSESDEQVSEKKYVKPSTSVMQNAPDWDAVKPALSTDNPSVVRVVAAKSQVETIVEPVGKESKKKKYVQPSASVMQNAPDWDAVKPAISTDNPSVVSVVAAKSQVPQSQVERKVEAVDEEPKKKKYVQPPGSVMKNAPDWDAVKPALSTDNPAVVSVVLPSKQASKPSVVAGAKSQAEQKPEEPEDEEPKKKRYVQPAASAMQNVPDWDAVKPAISTDNPAVVSVVLPSSQAPKPIGGETKAQKEEKVVDKKMEKEAEKPKTERYVKPSVSAMADVPDWNSVQPALSTSNPSVVNVDGINKIGEGGKRLVRPPSASMEVGTDKKTRVAPADTPFEYKQIQSIPDENPAGAKPIQDEETKTKLPASIAHAAGSSSDGWTPSAHFPSDEEDSKPDGKESKTTVKRQRSPQSSTMENFDPDALTRPTGVIPLKVSSSTKEKTQLFRGEHSLEPVVDGDEGDEGTEEAEGKKYYLYDGSNPQPKDPWDFHVEGSDTRLDQTSQEESSTKKLVAYERSSDTKAASDAVEGSDKNTETTDRKLTEKTVSPFTRNVDMKTEAGNAGDNKKVETSDDKDDSIDAEAKDA